MLAANPASVKLPARAVRSMFLRSLSIQGSWNYRTLQGSGFAYALMPVLRVVYAGNPAGLSAAVARHAGLFNAHPYLTGVALGAVARMEAEGADPALIERFKSALRGSLGALGDRIFWAGWRPACVLLALVVLLALESAAVAVIVFLLIYNAGHLTLRLWGLRIGLAHGRDVGEQLRRAPLLEWHQRVIAAAAFMSGVALPLIASGALTNSTIPLPWALCAGAVAAGAWLLGSTTRVLAIAVVSVASVAGVIMGLLR